MSTKTITLWGVNCCGATFLKKKSYRCERQATASIAEMFFTPSARIENKRELLPLIMIA